MQGKYATRVRVKIHAVAEQADPIYLLGSDFVVSEGFAGDDVGGDGSSVGGAGDFDFSYFLVFAVDEESLVNLGHRVQGKIEDDKSQGRMN